MNANRTKQEKFIVRTLRGMSWWLIGEIVCMIFNMCMLLLMQKFMILKIFTGIASVLIMNGLYFNFTYNTAVSDKNLIRYHHVPDDKFMSLKIALTAPLPQYIMWVILMLSKLGVIRDIFNIYILANIQSIAFVDLFTTGRTINDLSWGGLFGLLFLVLIAPAVIIATYECTVRDIDIVNILIYGGKKKK